MDTKSGLIKKVKAGLIKAGFPLELNIAKILKDNGWLLSLGSYYLDFETGKHREFDIAAEKIINGITINLMIECKKSSDKQLILYAPSSKSILKSSIFSSWFKIFPQLKRNNNVTISSTETVIKAFNKLELFSKDHSFSTNTIFTKGDKILQDNVSFFSSLNGLIKKSIHVGGDGYNTTGFRSIFFYIVIYDGIMLQLSPSDKEDFDLKEIDYGQLEFDYHFKVPPEYYETYGDDIKSFGQKYIIEMMSPNYFKSYLNKINKTIEGVNKDSLEGWGEDWPSFL